VKVSPIEPYASHAQPKTAGAKHLLARGYR
jgi:hypothetical protein